ncbi:hypothetical protein H696_02468 [Fonticula alba]|uniref:Uncharacterized protein n=1 Tax=Fonticula alba TaxID=691883 RepID=A0A058ZC56_FONAL|nr:hypothetical protein H696_02468 [Fonticula alba]KCV71531.1 hypothetical protein H696_02468 [Fonticula alba]|eukprot:XP_009494654.1 hypothetical protein H696_02468 [Fonticula alba]
MSRVFRVQPFLEAAPAFVMIGGAFLVSSVLFDTFKRLTQNGKSRRFGITDFDFYLMERDVRITGSTFHQRDILGRQF